MTRRELAARQAQWARFRAWEETRSRETTSISGEAAIRAVGEVVEFYMQVSGDTAAARRDVAEKVEAVRRLHQALRFAAPVR